MKFCSISGCQKKAERRGWCQCHHWRWQHYGDPLREPYAVRTCGIAGCNRKHKGHGYCAFHFQRLKQGVPLNYEKPHLSFKRYKLLEMPLHPLAMKNGKVFEHRMVLYDSVGGGRLPCFWCGKPLEWRKNLCVDHLDHDRHHNEVINLVPACNGCNAGRTITNSYIRQSVYHAAE